MKFRSYVIAVLALLPLSAWAFAALPGHAPRSSGTAKVAEVTDGDTLVLADKVVVRLVGIQAPKLPLDRPHFKEWPLARESRRALERIVLDHTLTVRPTAKPIDRWGRTLAHLERDDGLWVQGEMLRSGWARVYTFSDNRALAAEMLALERNARAARRGIWGHPYYSIVTPERAHRVVNTFQIVEGTVLDAAAVKNRVYLNFGPDWKTDFTVLVPARVRTMLARQGLDAAALKGRTVRVRGWIKNYNGPMIELSHPEQLELPGHEPMPPKKRGGREPSP
ncbi:thermonuclease family protein [Emcibacter sp. SYSU 3D8]|uniref:thermonuclease family protein n=1 Tax=Emcibacter sp. SYSU 3D8 TaxID=3133969 RepID=UPI0031FE7B51